ncbi:RSCA1 protein, partial [Tricholaema leucomelas]|nr:RSCA1 protein [Tricholaema leucomelas]
LPSLPAPDGFQNPVQSPGLNSKICNPTNQLLDRSASAPASLCSPGSSLPEPIDAGAGESAASATPCQTTPEQHQHLSTNAPLAGKDPSPQPGELTCGSPACLSQQTLKEAGVADSQRECDAEEQGPAQEHPLEVAEESGLAAAAVKHERNKDGCLSLQQKNELPTDHQVSKDPEKEQLEEQTETTHPEGPCHVEKPGVGEGSQPENPPMERRGDGQEEAGLSPAEGSIQVSASCSCLQTEAFMEVDVVEQSVAEEHISASEQRHEHRSAAGLGLEPFSMEVELLKSVSSSSGTPVKCNELSALAAEDSSCPSSICQLDTDPGRPAEEPCSSLASALKELHKLLVISRKAECKFLASEEVSQLEVVHGEPAAQQEGLSEGEQKGSAPAIQEQSCSFCEVRSEGGRAEGKQLCDAGRESASSGPLGHVQSAPGGAASEVLRCSAKSDLVVVNSAAASDQQQSSEQSEVLAEGTQSPTNSTSVCSALAPGAGAAPGALGTQSPSTGAPGRSSSAASEGTGPSGGCEEPPLSPVGSSAGLGSAACPPPAFPAADVGRLLGAGFTRREALEALERADGNADLALLILLAKGIVVPT